MEGLTRRSFLQKSGFAVAGAAIAGGLVGCAPKSGGSKQASATASTDVPSSWDHEADFVVIGSGTASYGAIAATENKGTSILVEKAVALGGTTRLSGCAVWVPGNQHQIEEGFGEDASVDVIVSYLVAGDVFNGSSEETKRDYVENAASFFSWIEENWGFRQSVYKVLGDYTDLPGCRAMGRSLIHVDDAGEFLGGDDLFSTKIEPLIEERGVEVLTETEATSLVVEDGKVVGIRARQGSKEMAVKANKGVLLGAGGFDRNENMRTTYLRGPIFGSTAAPGNTGDGHRMGMRIGADFENMGSMWQCPFYVIDDSGELSASTDWFEYGGLPGSLTVNTQGRRFTDENTAYGMANLAFWNYDTDNFKFANLPAFQICDSQHISFYGWPAQLDHQPEWLKEYQTLKEIASAYGIDANALEAEVERFNGFCATGKDLDFGRGEGNYWPINVKGYAVDRPELVNPCLAPITTPPFYVAQIAPGSIGTSGGLRVNLDAQVLDAEGKPIEGLYSCGNNSGAICGSMYPGAGGTDGPGFYQAVKAANHACGLGLF